MGRCWWKDPNSNQFVIREGEVELNDDQIQLNGYGRYISEREFQQGQYCDGLLHGQAKVNTSNGQIFMGTFQNAILSGPGKRYYPSGIIEEGHFKNYSLNGQGRRIMPDGSVLSGIFRDGNLISD